jgi:mono/diheme cytochrome c family protein
VALRLRLAVLLSLALVLTAQVAYGSSTANRSSTATVPARFEPAKKLYRQFCGQCHALKEARAVGFGSASSKGAGEEGGPSFNPLKIRSHLSVLAVTGVWDGHDKVARRMTWKQIYLVADFIEAATRDHPHVATMPSDGY